MYYIWHFGFSGPRIGELKELLETSYTIPCDIIYDSDKTSLLSIGFDVEETHPKFDEIIKVISHGQWDTNDGSGNNLFPVVHYPVYSEDEYLSAKWLSVRSSFSKIMPVNESQLYSYHCVFGKDNHGVPRARHVEENGTYILKKPIRWNRNYFASSVTSEHILFCNDIARSILEHNQIKGVKFRQVIRKATGEPMDNLCQLINTYTVPNGIITGLTHTRDYVCPQCGMKMLSWNDDRFRFGIHDGIIPDELDFCRTMPLFIGFDPDKTYGAHSVTLISQRMYRVLRTNMLDRSLWFEPIDMV